MLTVWEEHILFLLSVIAKLNNQEVSEFMYVEKGRL